MSKFKTPLTPTEKQKLLDMVRKWKQKDEMRAPRIEFDERGWDQDDERQAQILKFMAMNTNENGVLNS